MIIVSITGPTMEDALAQISASRRYASMFELRLDMITRPDIIGLMAASRKPVIATCRTKKQGGSFKGTEKDRVLLLELSAAFGTDFIDLEIDDEKTPLGKFLGRTGSAKVMLSVHFGSSPNSVSALYQKMRKTGAHVLKLAYAITDAHEIRAAVDFLSLAGKDKQPAVAIAMGEDGEASRVLYKRIGGWGTFAAAEAGSPSAAGQVTASVLKKVYRSDMLDQRTKIFGVIGFPLGQSKGVFLHNPLFQSTKSKSVYCRFPVKNLAAFMKTLAPMLEGFSVTLPHKVEIMKYLQEVDPEAEAIGAVNTVVRTPRGLRGTNTDGAGALDAVEQYGPVDGRKVLILGAGGAARAVAFSAKQRGAEVTVINRTDSKAKKLATDLDVNFTPIKNLNNVPCDIFVNATPVGMTPEVNRTPVPKSLLKGKVVFDLVYNPPVTKLLKEAHEVGSVVVPGTEMYCRQAARQSEWYSGKRPSLTRIRKLLGYDQAG